MRPNPPCLNCEELPAINLEPFGAGNGFISGFCSVECWQEAEGIDDPDEILQADGETFWKNARPFSTY